MHLLTFWACFYIFFIKLYNIKKALNYGLLHVFHLFVCKWIFYIGAPDKIWTCTIAHTPLKRARLPIPPLVHIFIINSCNKMSMWL